MKAKIVNFIQNTILALSILLCVFILAQKFIFKENGIYGYRTFVIITSSMQPHLEIGDVIIVKSVNVKDLKEGDIITYLGNTADFKGKIVTHMIKTIDKAEDGSLLFYTKGTVSNMVDPVVKETQIYGKLEYRFFLISLVSKAIRSKYGFVLLIFIPLIIILIKQLLTIRKEVKKEKFGITDEEIEAYKKNHKIKYSLFKSNKKNKDKIIEIKDTLEELEKTIYSEAFKKDIQRELEKTMININLKDEIDKKLEEEESKVIKPKHGLENTIIDGNLLEEIKKFENKIPDIIIIDDNLPDIIDIKD